MHNPTYSFKSLTQSPAKPNHSCYILHCGHYMVQVLLLLCASCHYSYFKFYCNYCYCHTLLMQWYKHLSYKFSCLNCLFNVHTALSCPFLIFLWRVHFYCLCGCLNSPYGPVVWSFTPERLPVKLVFSNWELHLAQEHFNGSYISPFLSVLLSQIGNHPLHTFRKKCLHLCVTSLTGYILPPSVHGNVQVKMNADFTKRILYSCSAVALG